MKLFAIIVAAGLAALAAPASAQCLSNGVPCGLPDQVVSAVQELTPPVCNAVPPMDTPGGTVGVASPCTPRSDATRRAVIQAKETTTAADATYSVTFDMPFASTPIYVDARVTNTNLPYVCSATATATGATGKCYQIVSTTLPTLTTSLLGLVVSPITNAAAGQSVRVVARQ